MALPFECLRKSRNLWDLWDVQRGRVWCRAVAEKYQAVYAADKTHNLIVRLRHNVIRAGLRRINMAYSRISLQDVAAKLGNPRMI